MQKGRSTRNQCGAQDPSSAPVKENYRETERMENLGLIKSTVNFEHWMEHKRHTNGGRYNISLGHKSTLNMQLGHSGERIDRISVSDATHMLPLLHPRVTPMTSR